MKTANKNEFQNTSTFWNRLDYLEYFAAKFPHVKHACFVRAIDK
jgi:hypothetical protein